MSMAALKRNTATSQDGNCNQICSCNDALRIDLNMTPPPYFRHIGDRSTLQTKD